MNIHSSKIIIMKKNVLITGTSTGVGFESAILFAKNNFKVYASMRNLKKAVELEKRIAEENLDIEILSLDVTKIDSINATEINLNKKISIYLELLVGHVSFKISPSNAFYDVLIRTTSNKSLGFLVPILIQMGK